MRLHGKRSLYSRSAALSLPLAEPYFRCLSAFLLLVKSHITTEISSANADFGGAADNWHTAMLPSTITNIVNQIRHKGRQAWMTVVGCNF
ncbi:hypothetical protein TNCV_977831 [Trichonephila clavipes]|nr:hypothetical protein TNCV_977831 [Trichonephila clavipes]